MGKTARIIRNVLCIVAGVIVVVTLALQLVLNSSWMRHTVERLAADNIDADLEWSDMKLSLVRSFPRIAVELDTLSLTYPHDRFSSFDRSPVRSRLLSAGRGPQKDTLLRFDRFSARVNVWHILAGRIRLSGADLDGLRLYAHSYDGQTANWDIFKASEEEEDTTATSLNLPWISAGPVRIGGNPEVVYTAQSDTLFACIDMDSFMMKGDVKLGRRGMRLRNVLVDLDSLHVNGRLPADSIDFRLDRLDVDEHLSQKFDIGLDASALAVTNAFGRIHVPLSVDALAGFENSPGETRIDIDRLDAELAYIPLSVEGYARLFADSTYVKADARIHECSLGTLLEKYAATLVSAAADFSTDAVLDLAVSADGVISDDSMPAVEASLHLPSSRVFYAPYELPARVALDVEASMDPSMYVKAVVRQLHASAPGLVLDLDGRGDDVLGSDPRFRLEASASAVLDTLMRFIPDDLGIVAGGDFDAFFKADARMSELNMYQFDDASISGHLSSSHIDFEMPADTLDACIHNPSLMLSSGKDGIIADVNADSIYFALGADMIAKIRGMKNNARLYKVESRGKMTPRLEFTNTDRGVYMQYGDNRIGLMGAEIAAAVQKRVRGDSERRKHMLDSLQRVYPGVPRNELFAMSRGEGSHPSGDLSSGDLDISLDSTITRYLRQWRPSGHIKLGRGFVASPSFPLRTRLMAFAGEFDGKDLSLDTLLVKSGSSDISAKGKVTGLGRALMRRGDIKLGLDAHSSRLNVNEILAAVELGKNAAHQSPVSEDDESFVVDDLESAMPDSLSSMSLIIVPANVTASVNLLADRVDYTDITASPVTASLKIEDRTLQLCDTRLSSDIGRIGLDAFYSTHSMSDISAGMNLKLEEISAGDIIHLMPGVDDMMPALKSFKGLLGCEISATTQLDTNMNILIPTLDGLIRISGENLVVEDAGDLRKITKLLLFKNKDIGEIDNLYVDAVIHDSRVEVFPFELGVDRYKLALRGMQGLDKSMNYHVSILKSPFLVRFGVNLFGTLDNWHFNLTLPKYREGSMPQFTQELDEMHVNILESIRNIFQRGKRGVNEYNRQVFQAIEDKKTAVRYDDESVSRELTFEEFLQIDSLAFDYEALEWESELMEEIDDVLAESYSQMEKLMSQYAEMTYDKSLERRMERIRRKEEKKAARAAKH